MCSATMIITFSNFHRWVGSTLRLVSLLLEPTLWTNQKVKPRFDQRRPVSPSHRFTLTLDAEKTTGDLPKRWPVISDGWVWFVRIHEAVMKHSFIWASCIWMNKYIVGIKFIHYHILCRVAPSEILFILQSLFLQGPAGSLEDISWRHHYQIPNHGPPRPSVTRLEM